jgi:mRNA-degrading endonuclease RelE of RelBE toxin-antitoxin system
MNFKIKTLTAFDKDVKRLYKRYKQLPKDLKLLNAELLENPKAGIKLGNGCYKIRLVNSSIPTGKSGGFRVIYYYIDMKNNLFLMTMYAKNELENIDDKVILKILKENGLFE